MKEKLYDKKIQLLIGLFLLIFVILLSLFLFKKETKNGTERNHIKQEKYYTYKVSYPILSLKELDTSITSYIKNLKAEFVKKAETDKPKEPYELNVSYAKNTYQDITFLELTVYKYTGGNHYAREEKSYYFNFKTKKQLRLSDFFLEGKDYLHELSKYAKEEVLNYASSKGKTFDEAWVNKGTEEKEENFKHFFFNDSGLTIIFPPYQVSSWADGEVRITIPFTKINRYLKEVYRRKVEGQTELPNITRPKIDLKEAGGKKLMAITFDDGPSHNTAYLLDELKKRDARVTFFVLGNRASQFTEEVRREYSEGHLVGSHTYSHLNLVKLPEEVITSEITRASEEIEKITGDKPTYLRPPYGSTNERVKQISNMYTILWNIDTLDWKHRNADMVYQNIIDHAKDGSIVLLHDLYATSVEGAIRAIDTLKAQGYAFVTVEEMAKIKGVSLDKTKSYTSFIK
ncbi:MAG: polysaccharide deacetylase family protein [Bacilli bacterium]|nr:polysaccharide deacetylase family protein [Bacilli bacterium]